MSQLLELTENLWTVEHDVFMPGSIHFPARMVVVRLSDNKLLLHSPVPMEQELIDQLNELGEVAFIVAPNMFHHLYFQSATRAFPEAQRWVAPGLASKRSDLKFDKVLGDAPPPWREDLEQVWIGGVPSINETVFYHKASRTLICTDLLFHIHHVDNWWTRWLLKSLGVWQRPAQSKLWRFFARDRAQIGGSIQEILRWPLDRVVMAHGTPLEGPEAKVELVTALGWMLQATASARLPA